MNSNELRPVDDSNYQALQNAPNQAYPLLPNQNYSPVPNTVPVDGSISARLMGAKIVRIRLASKCACNKSCSTPYYQINTVARVDDLNPVNEGEAPLLEAELADPSCCPEPMKFEYIDAQTKQRYCTSQYKDFGQKVTVCCGDNYYVIPDIIHSKMINPGDACITNCYDSRSFYRTFNYGQGAYYKIGQPYVPSNDCDCCCCCKPKTVVVKNPVCCDCCKVVPLEKRVYADIFNMSNQSVGKFVKYFNEVGCCCCQTTTLFFEVYFPQDANEMLRLGLIGQLIFLIQEGFNIWAFLPGSKDNLGMFIN